MAALGDKIGSSLIAQAAEVPTLPWSGSHVQIPPESCSVSIPDDLYSKACVYTTEEAIASCQVVGYPAMIKASWVGGGKGIRKVHNDDEVKALFKQVQGEVPGSPIFIMKVASQVSQTTVVRIHIQTHPLYPTNFITLKKTPKPSVGITRIPERRRGDGDGELKPFKSTETCVRRERSCRRDGEDERKKKNFVSF